MRYHLDSVVTPETYQQAKDALEFELLNHNIPEFGRFYINNRPKSFFYRDYRGSGVDAWTIEGLLAVAADIRVYGCTWAPK